MHATKAAIRVVLVNTVYNGDPSSEREYLASTIAGLMRKNAKTNSRYKPVAVLLVDFVKRGHWRTKTVEFCRIPQSGGRNFRAPQDLGAAPRGQPDTTIALQRSSHRPAHPSMDASRGVAR